MSKDMMPNFELYQPDSVANAVELLGRLGEGVWPVAGGNDSLSTVIPYRDPSYASRRPTLAIPAGNVLQIGRDSSNVASDTSPSIRGQVARGRTAATKNPTTAAVAAATNTSAVLVVPARSTASASST